MIPAARLALPAALACAVVLVPVTAAAAAEPERTGWWNRLSGGGMSLPQPTTQAGDLRVASGPDAPSAFSALLYTAPGSVDATLDVAVRQGSTIGTPEVVACPTTTTDWPEGENLPYDTAPGYDCEAGLAFGSLSEDGGTLSFLLDVTTQIEPGVWSLALVPQPGSTTGLFSIDLQKPAPDAFVAAPADLPEDPAPPSDGGSGATGGGSGEPADPMLPTAVDPLAGSGSADLPPLVAGGESAALPPPAAPGPAVASGVPQAAPPLFRTSPAGVVEDLGAGRRLLALLVLAGGSAAVGYAAGQQRPGPRLLGGRARLGTTPALAAATGGSAEERPRGIGRFAKARDAAPRRLR